MLIEILVVLALPVAVVAFVRDILRDPGIFFVRCDPRLDRVRHGLYGRLREARGALFDGSDNVRFTVLLPDDERPAELRPVLRFGWGRPSSESPARFRRGEGLAGRAWAQASPVLVARLPAGSSPERMRELHRELFSLRSDSSAALSDTTLKVQVMLACAIGDPTGVVRGVLCLDVLDGSLVPDATCRDADAVAWYRLLYLDRSMDPWVVSLLALLEVLPEKGATALLGRLELSERLKRVVRAARFSGHRVVRALTGKPEPSPAAVWRLLSGLDDEAMVFLMAASRSEAVKRHISAYLTTYRATRPMLRIATSG